jgi:hypothetical protein
MVISELSKRLETLKGSLMKVLVKSNPMWMNKMDQQTTVLMNVEVSRLLRKVEQTILSILKQMNVILQFDNHDPGFVLPNCRFDVFVSLFSQIYRGGFSLKTICQFDRESHQNLIRFE